jgi:flagellar M-ring protein FliF
MSTTLPAAPAGSVLTQLTDPSGGSVLQRVKGFAAQPAIKKTLPWFAGVVAIGGVALTWSALSPDPQRTLYSQLDDNERASVVQALDKASIPYKIDNNTGSLTVNESDLYKARMTVASDGALATPDSGDDMLNNLPIGASRTLEGERLQAAKEHELMLTIKEIDGVEAVRVHLAEGEKSAFIRDNAPPTASVMLKLAKGRQLSDGQVQAIVNLVGASVPGLTPDAVKVIDQHGRLLTDRSAKGDSDRLELQARMEEKLRAQLTSLLTPMVGEGNFSSQVQVELDMDQVTSARESYDKQGVLRSETAQQSSTAGGSGAGTAVGVPGTLSNTPPPQTQAVSGPPAGTATATGPGAQTAPAAAASPAPVNGESNTTRNYELGREVAVANTTPGKLKRLSVAVALSQSAMKGMKPADLDQIKQLVSAAVGADTTRGDQVAVMVRKFDTTAADDATPFYETSWFGMILRNAIALIAVLLVLLMGVRPLIKALRREPSEDVADSEAGDGPMLPSPAAVHGLAGGSPLTGAIDNALLGQQVSLAQRMVEEQPESAVIALRQMLKAQGVEAA